MKRKKKSNLPDFTLSEFASKDRDDFARTRNSKNSLLILKESCGQTKLEVLKAHPEREEWDWLRKLVERWFKERGITPEKVNEITEDLFIITIPRRVKSRKWTHFLESYLNKAAKGFFNNFWQKQYRRERIERIRIQQMGDDPIRVRQMFDEVLCLDSISKIQRQIILLSYHENNLTREDMAKRLTINTKTIQRELRKIRENKDVQKIGSEFLRRISSGVSKEVKLRGSYLCKQCKKTFASLYCVILEKCKDHDGLEEI